MKDTEKALKKEVLNPKKIKRLQMAATKVIILKKLREEFAGVDLLSELKVFRNNKDINEE